jgi:hypothetical protein
MTPKAVPAMAPVNSEGADTSPDPPMPMVRLAVHILAAVSTSSNHSTMCPSTALSMTG